MQERLKALKKAHGSKSLGETTVDMCIGGMRGIPVSAALGLGRRRGRKSVQSGLVAVTQRFQADHKPQPRALPASSDILLKDLAPVAFTAPRGQLHRHIQMPQSFTHPRLGMPRLPAPAARCRSRPWAACGWRSGLTAARGGCG